MKKISVFKIGGQVTDNPALLQTFCEYVAALPQQTVLVHGGGKMAARLCEKLGIPVQMHEGRRITDKPTLDVATMVYAGLVNKQIVAHIQAAGRQALGVSGADLNLIRSVKRPVKEIDYGWVGDVKEANTTALDQLLDLHILPVCCAITHDNNGQLLNTNADTIAHTMAVALAKTYEVSLIYCFEKRGVLQDAEDDNSLIPSITTESYKKLKHEGVIYAGMIPKLDNAFDALKQGVHQVRVVSAQEQANNSNVNQEIGTLLSLE